MLYVGLLLGYSVLVVEEEGFEPSKYKYGRFTVCSLWPLGHSSVIKIRRGTRAGGENRTRDLLITNQVLYQLSYTSVIISISNARAELARAS